ncbi:MAG: hypothetical protein IKF52_07015 [Clostridia bacterium]|nr:hypothetical protein [Clostridia bacterium]
MKKKYIIIIIITLVLLLTGGIVFYILSNNQNTKNKQNTTKKDIAIQEQLQNVIEGKENFIDWNGKERNIFDKLKKEELPENITPEEEEYENLENRIINKYCLIDINDDGLGELLASIPSNNDFNIYLLLYRENGKNYGYITSSENITDIKTDGSFNGINEESESGYFQFVFNNGQITTKSLASKDGNSYTIDGVIAFKNSYEKFERKFIKKESVKWLDYNYKNEDKLKENFNSKYEIDNKGIYEVTAGDIKFTFSTEEQVENLAEKVFSNEAKLFYYTNTGITGIFCNIEDEITEETIPYIQYPLSVIDKETQTLSVLIEKEESEIETYIFTFNENKIVYDTHEIIHNISELDSILSYYSKEENPEQPTQDDNSIQEK